MTRRRLDPAGAFRVARKLEKYIKVNEPAAARAMRRVVAELAVSAVSQLRAVPSLAADTIALAVLIENPGLSNNEIARRAGCSAKTLERSVKFRRVREMMASGREKYSDASVV